ncbi:tripartite motif-containing protein 60-like [Sorex fumeus]|uniref:tripartite motif-containing protein 60-like n=1 Tax=Sorex fumeus TaxID=62283 RepID=UPI0024AE2DF0|nr:tripartite motif-containing protein 60-like [Sorex fumeus]
MEEVSAALAKMQPELICHICLDYLNDPITIYCRHNFCDSCIRMSWKDLQDTFPCPVSQQSCQELRVSANAQLGSCKDLRICKGEIKNKFVVVKLADNLERGQLSSKPSLAEIPAEASCPHCLDYLRDPVTLECGHNFCDSCIHQCWIDLQDVFPCPVCLHHCPDRNFKRNNQLRHVTEVLKQLPTGKSKRKWQAEEPLCEKHNEALDLFCEEDQQLLCPQCRISTHHQAHHLIPTDRAAESQRKKLKGFIELLKTKMSDAEKECENQIAQSVEGRWKIASWKEELQTEFEQFKLSLSEEQFSIHVSLLNREREMEEQIAQNKSQSLSSMNTVKILLGDITEKCLQADQDFLATAENLQHRYKNPLFPTVSSYEFKNESYTLPPNYVGLHKIMSKFQENLTLDPDTAHPSLTISKDRSSVHIGSSHPHLLDHRHVDNIVPFPALQCCESFDGGRHFWQVEVRGIGECSLGVCKASFHDHTWTLPFSQSDLWQSDITLSFPGNMHIERPEQFVRTRIGVFLDYEMGELSIFNMNNRSCLHRLTGTLSEKVIPYFAIGPLSKSLTMHIVRDE